MLEIAMLFAGKESCFERIRSRFGRKCTYVVIGDGPDEDSAARQVSTSVALLTDLSLALATHSALNSPYLLKDGTLCVKLIELYKNGKPRAGTFSRQLDCHWALFLKLI